MSARRHGHGLPRGPRAGRQPSPRPAAAPPRQSPLTAPPPHPPVRGGGSSGLGLARALRGTGYRDSVGASRCMRRAAELASTRRSAAAGRGDRSACPAPCMRRRTLLLIAQAGCGEIWLYSTLARHA
jgi:hypothetical protein